MTTGHVAYELIFVFLARNLPKAVLSSKEPKIWASRRLDSGRKSLVGVAAGERPALLVTIHGGPTAFASQTLSMEKQFWTSRGFAVADIDYR
eukprot:scaffold566529_cov45-Prasinocladus_malaysianus.AAC.1